MYPERVMKALQRAQANLNAGNPSAAMADLEKAVQKYPKGYDCWLLYGQAKGGVGDHEAAERCFRKAIALQPKNIDGWNNLGISLSSRQMYQPAADAYLKAVDLDPLAHPDIYHNLGSCLLELEQYEDAARVFEATSMRKDSSDIWALLAIAYQGLMRYEQARDAYLKALARGGNGYTVNLNLGTCYSVLNDCENAALYAQRALAIKPDDPVALHNLGSALFNAGRVQEAIDAYAKSTLPDASASLLLSLNYLDPPSPAQLRSQHEATMARETAGIERHPLQKTRKPEQRLRVGLVSPDFREHPVAHFIEGMLSRIDRRRFELFFYSDVRKADTDNVTARFQALCDQWRDTADADDDALAALVRGDEIHVLIDLAGHTHTRLKAFARRLALVQASYLGYSATTGLAEMDYLLADDVLVPDQASEAHYSEQVMRLGPVLASYTPPDDAVAVAPLPMQENGYPTFGSFAQLRKISPSTVQLWVDALNAVPHSRMLVMGKGLHTDAVKERFLSPFMAQGIDPSRFILRGSGSMEEYLRAHGDIDLILDTAPWNGHTTTMHALWMGVPTLSVKGNHHTSRFGEMVLRAASLEEYLVNDKSDFGARAAALVSDPARMAKERAQMRSRLMASPLCDHDAMARHFENACMSMWDRLADPL